MRFLFYRKNIDNIRQNITKRLKKLSQIGKIRYILDFTNKRDWREKDVSIKRATGKN